MLLGKDHLAIVITELTQGNEVGAFESWKYHGLFPGRRERRRQRKLTKTIAFEAGVIGLLNTGTLDVLDVLKDTTINLFPIMLGGGTITFGHDDT